MQAQIRTTPRGGRRALLVLVALVALGGALLSAHGRVHASAAPTLAASTVTSAVAASTPLVGGVETVAAAQSGLYWEVWVTDYTYTYYYTLCWNEGGVPYILWQDAPGLFASWTLLGCYA